MDLFGMPLLESGKTSFEQLVKIVPWAPFWILRLYAQHPIFFFYKLFFFFWPNRARSNFQKQKECESKFWLRKKNKVVCESCGSKHFYFLFSKLKSKFIYSCFFLLLVIPATGFQVVNYQILIMISRRP